MKKDLLAGFVLVAFAFIVWCTESILIDVKRFERAEVIVIAGLAFCFAFLVGALVIYFGGYL